MRNNHFTVRTMLDNRLVGIPTAPAEPLRGNVHMTSAQRAEAEVVEPYKMLYGKLCGVPNADNTGGGLKVPNFA